jgi:molecular chaperone GrpE
MTELEQNMAATGPPKSEAEPKDSGEELLELLQRERASFLNYKRRVEQERTADREDARGEVLLLLLPVLDELDRALDHRPRDLETHPWAEGMALIYRRLMQALHALGLERIGVEGEEFDPARHEAVLYEGRPDATDQRVAALLSPGYRLGGRLLRPAQVSVVA